MILIKKNKRKANYQYENERGDDIQTLRRLITAKYDEQTYKKSQ